jgi:hypothetical protein
MCFHDYFPKEKNATKYSHLVFSFVSLMQNLPQKKTFIAMMHSS